MVSGTSRTPRSGRRIPIADGMTILVTSRACKSLSEHSSFGSTVRVSMRLGKCHDALPILPPGIETGLKAATLSPLNSFSSTEMVVFASMFMVGTIRMLIAAISPAIGGSKLISLCTNVPTASVLVIGCLSTFPAIALVEIFRSCWFSRTPLTGMRTLAAMLTVTDVCAGIVSDTTIRN